MAEDQAPVEAPKIKAGKGWTVDCVKLKIVDEFPDYWLIQFGDGTTDEISKKALVDLDWQPPAPVLRVGGKVDGGDGDTLTVKYIGKHYAVVEDHDGDEFFETISSLTPLEDEGQ